MVNSAPMTAFLHSALVVKALHGAATAVLPIAVADIGIVYRWTQQNQQTFGQVFNWRVAGKNLLGAVIGGVMGAFALPLVGINI